MENITTNMTVISQIMYDKATQIQTVSEAKNVLLENKEVFRSFKTTVQFFSGMDDPKKLLVDGLLCWKTNLGRDSISRNVRNWLNGKTSKIGKEDAFILSRVLHLSIERTDEFLKLLLGEGIHWRTPEDIVWAYSIVQDLEPSETLGLLDRVKTLNITPKADLLTNTNSYTNEVYKKLEPVLYGSQEELFVFLENERMNLGYFHNTAYGLFVQFMELLQEGFSDSDIETLFRQMTQKEKKKKEEDEQARRETEQKKGEALGQHAYLQKDRPVTDGDTELYQPEPMTIRDVLETYMYRKLIPAIQKDNEKSVDTISLIRRSIRQSWPDEFMLSRMKNRQIDVSRKVLILLFLATDGSNSDFAEMDEDEDILMEDDAFRDIYIRLNLMLQSCGFQMLDTRSPFDWIILYCICAGDLGESDNRFQELLMEIFSEQENMEI